MSQGNAVVLFGQFQQFKSILSPSTQAALATIGSSLLSNPNAALRSMWQLALVEINNPQALRQALNLCKPALGALGVGWANIEIASLALTGMTATAVITAVAEVIFWICVAVLVILLVLLAIWLLYQATKLLASFFVEAMSWTNNRNPTPMQTPNWGRLLNSLHSSSIGPIYAIEMQVKPSAISA